MKMRAIGYLLVAGIFGFMVGVTGNQAVSDEGSTNEPEPQPTVTVVAEVPVDNGTTPVVELPEQCDRAMELASEIHAQVSPVAGSMGEQMAIVSRAREAMTGSNYIDMGKVMRDQADLDESFAGNYTRLASMTYSLEIAIEGCESELEGQ